MDTFIFGTSGFLRGSSQPWVDMMSCCHDKIAHDGSEVNVAHGVALTAAASPNPWMKTSFFAVRVNRDDRLV
jgi:hypothetical protein